MPRAVSHPHAFTATHCTASATLAPVAGARHVARGSARQPLGTRHGLALLGPALL